MKTDQGQETASALVRRSRHERKLAQRARWAAQEEWRRQHPIISGAIKIVDYVPPYGTYTPNTKVSHGGAHE